LLRTETRLSGEVTIRSVTRQDYAQWLPLWDGYNAFYGRSGATALAPEITDMTWQRFFDFYEPVHALVADRGGELLGLTHYLFHRSTTAIEPTCYLQDHQRRRARQRRRAGADRGRLRAGEAGRFVAGLLADSRDQPHRDAALRQRRGEVGFCGLSPDFLESLVLTRFLHVNRYPLHSKTLLAAFTRLRSRTVDLWISFGVTGA
jgi:hypothetical protein